MKGTGRYLRKIESPKRGGLALSESFLASFFFMVASIIFSFSSLSSFSRFCLSSRIIFRSFAASSPPSLSYQLNWKHTCWKILSSLRARKLFFVDRHKIKNSIIPSSRILKKVQWSLRCFSIKINTSRVKSLFSSMIVQVRVARLCSFSMYNLLEDYGKLSINCISVKIKSKIFSDRMERLTFLLFRLKYIE